jgi:HK97 gp10 family phage protein
MLSFQTDLSQATNGLDNLAKHVNNFIIRAGAQAAAQVFYDEARANAPVAESGHWFYGTHQKYFFPAGTLKASIYQVFSKTRSHEGLATYQVSWNHKKAPYGFMVEYGTSRAPAHPFMRPAWGKAMAAGEAAKRRMSERMQENAQGELL